MSSWHAIPGLSRLIASSSGSQPARQRRDRRASNLRTRDNDRTNLLPALAIDEVIDNHPDFFRRPYANLVPSREEFDLAPRNREPLVDSVIEYRYQWTDPRRVSDDIDHEWARQVLHRNGDDLWPRRSRHSDFEARFPRLPRYYHVEEVRPERSRLIRSEDHYADRPRRNARDYTNDQPVRNNAPRAPRPGGEVHIEQLHVQQREQEYEDFEQFGVEQSGVQQREQEDEHFEDWALTQIYLSVPAIQEADEEFAIGQPGPSTYVRRPEPRDCAVCGETKALTEFDERPPTTSCQHAVQTCRECLQYWIASEFNTKGCDGIICSECPGVLTHDDVRRVASPEVFAQFDRLSARNAMSQIEDFAWCLRPGCGFGQVNYHVHRDNRNFMCCETCKFEQCLRHRTSWHYGQTCEEVDAEAAALGHRSGEERSAAWVEARTKPCPNPRCGVRIEKAEGCDHMTCRKCRFQFCWQCLVPCETIRRLGNSAHKDYCHYHNDDAALGWPFNYH